MTLRFLAALGTALATGLGALPLPLRGHRRSAAGRLECPRFRRDARREPQPADRGRRAQRCRGRRRARSRAPLFVWIVQTSLSRDGPHLGALTGADARKALLIVAVMTAHSVAEGVGVGSSFGGGDTLGLVIAIAIAIHNMPEGLAISLVLVPRGVRVRAAAGWSVFSSLPQPALAVPAYLFVEAFSSILPAALGFAAGAMVWMVATELLPEATTRLPRLRVLEAAGLAFVVMFALQTVLIHY